jgi:hypothetical protein
MKTSFILTVITLVATFATGAVAKADGPAASVQSLVPVIDPAPVQIIRLSQLPSVAALVKAAATQGAAVRQITLTSGQVVVVYECNNGQGTSICYQLLPDATAASAPASKAIVVSSAQPAAQIIVVPIPETTVVVPAEPTVVCETQVSGPAYGYDSSYYPWPLSAPFGIGFSASHRGGYSHGGPYRESYGHGGSYRSSVSHGSGRSNMSGAGGKAGRL